MSEFSDPAWWPRKPPEPPKQIPVSKLLLGTLLPTLAIGGLVAYLVLSHTSAKPIVRSIAAFESCVSSVKFGAGAGLAMRACDEHLPAGVSFQPGVANTEEERFELCMQSGRASIHPSAFDLSGLRSAVKHLTATCQTLAAEAPGP